MKNKKIIDLALKNKPSSISGVQLKIIGDIVRGKVVAHKNGKYIFKIAHQNMNHVENEQLSLQIVKKMGIVVPKTLILKTLDYQKCLAVERFDINSKGEKKPVEDLCSAMGLESKDKYQSTYAEAAKFIRKSDQKEFFKRIFSSYLVGNSDLHLKNFSIYTKTKKLAPAYDVLNIWVLDSEVSGELGYQPELYPNQKVSHKINKIHFDVLAKEMGLSRNMTEKIYKDCVSGLKKSEKLILNSKLKKTDQKRYLDFTKMILLQFYDLGL